MWVSISAGKYVFLVSGLAERGRQQSGGPASWRFRSVCAEDCDNFFKFQTTSRFILK